LGVEYHDFQWSLVVDNEVTSWQEHRDSLGQDLLISS
jgi:hypothetical protein